MEESSDVHVHPDTTPNSVAGKILITPNVHSKGYTFISFKMNTTWIAALKYVCRELCGL